MNYEVGPVGTSEVESSALKAGLNSQDASSTQGDL